MAVRIGHASISERWSITGSAGDTNNREVFIRNWYLHNSGWVVLRCKDADKRELIARAMEMACKNSDIGYDQYQRDTLFNNVKNKGFDPSKTTKKVETDCSALVRVCIAYAYGKDIAGNIRTVTLPDRLVKTGKFTKYTSAKYCKSSDFLKRGDVICTPVSGHVVVCLDNGPKASSSTTASSTTSSSASKPSTSGALSKTHKWDGVVTADALNVRKGAGTSYGKCSFSPLNKGSIVSVCDSIKASNGDTWYYIKYKEKYGFVHSSYIKRCSYKTTASLNLRSEAGVINKNNVLCVIPKGKEVEYNGKTKTVNGVKWHHVTYAGKTGYASSKYLK